MYIFFFVILICATAWRTGWAVQIHTSFPVDFPSSIHWAEQFYSHTFQLLMWILMLNFPESSRLMWSFFSILDEDSKTPPSAEYTTGILLMKLELPLMKFCPARCSASLGAGVLLIWNSLHLHFSTWKTDLCTCQQNTLLCCTKINNNCSWNIMFSLKRYWIEVKGTMHWLKQSSL